MNHLGLYALQNYQHRGTQRKLHVPDRNHRKVKSAELVPDLLEGRTDRALVLVLIVLNRSISCITSEIHLLTLSLNCPARPESLALVERPTTGPMLRGCTGQFERRFGYLHASGVPPIECMRVVLGYPYRREIVFISEWSEYMRRTRSLEERGYGVCI